MCVELSKCLRAEKEGRSRAHVQAIGGQQTPTRGPNIVAIRQMYCLRSLAAKFKNAQCSRDRTPLPPANCSSVTADWDHLSLQTQRAPFARAPDPRLLHGEIACLRRHGRVSARIPRAQPALHCPIWSWSWCRACAAPTASRCAARTSSHHHQLRSTTTDQRARPTATPRVSKLRRDPCRTRARWPGLHDGLQNARSWEGRSGTRMYRTSAAVDKPMPGQVGWCRVRRATSSQSFKMPPASVAASATSSLGLSWPSVVCLRQC